MDDRRGTIKPSIQQVAAGQKPVRRVWRKRHGDQQTQDARQHEHEAQARHEDDRASRALPTHRDNPTRRCHVTACDIATSMIAAPSTANLCTT